MKKRIINIGVILLVFYGILYWMNASYIEDNGIPVMKITLNNTTLDTIHNHSKEEKYYGNTIRVYDHGKRILKSTVTMKGRGNSTWTFEKRPYQISFDEKTSILGLPESKKYVLLANMEDSSLLKNDFSYAFPEEEIVAKSSRPQGQVKC